MQGRYHSISEYGYVASRKWTNEETAGNDMLNAFMYSIDSVNEAHFSDRGQLVLPYPEWGVKYLNSSRIRSERTELERKIMVL